MKAGSVLLRTFRIAAIAAPVAAGIGYAVIYGTDYLFKLGCRERVSLQWLVLSLTAWLVLAVSQIAGYRSPLRWLDGWKIVVIAVSCFGFLACWEMFFSPPWGNNCQDISTYDYADDFIGVELVLLILCIPAALISALIAVVAAVKSKEAEDMERISPW